MAIHFEIGLYSNHDMFIYNREADLISHSIRFLKEGLENNERGILITNHLTPIDVENVLTNSWGNDFHRHKANGDFKVIDASQWYFRGRPLTFDSEHVIKAWSTLSNKAKHDGKSGLRAAADVSIFFMHQSIEDLVKYESRIKKIPTYPLNVICSYLKSDLSLLLELSLLSEELYYCLRNAHRQVYHM